VISSLKEKYRYTKLFMIGDGITDLEACPPADAFIGKFRRFGSIRIIQLTRVRRIVFRKAQLDVTPPVVYSNVTRVCYACIGFGGNVVREEVKSRSKWYVESFQELIDAL